MKETKKLKKKFNSKIRELSMLYSSMIINKLRRLSNIIMVIYKSINEYKNINKILIKD